MYLQFSLDWPDNVCVVLMQELERWAQQYQAGTYRTKIWKKTLRVTFDNEQMYSAFVLSWNTNHHDMFKYRMIEPMQTRQL